MLLARIKARAEALEATYSKCTHCGSTFRRTRTTEQLGAEMVKASYSGTAVSAEMVRYVGLELQGQCPDCALTGAAFPPAYSIGSVEIEADIKVKAPKFKREKTHFWLTPGNNLSDQNPKQTQMFPRRVGGEQPEPRAVGEATTPARKAE